MQDATMRPVDAYIGLGSNLGDPEARLAAATAALGRLPHSTLEAVSRIYRTAPVGLLEQPDYLNAVARLRTTLSPRDLLEALLAIEQAQGRMRGTPNGPRTLDLDLLLYGDARIDEHDLMVPHPRMTERAFVMVPLAELAPGLSLVSGDAVSAIAQRLRQQQRTEPAGGPVLA
jgi:2-amino-4-hydroxy-6-hydroxymethyldihydropteridine diphosphokinase